jgi:transcriptional regulator with XRE-family HTH domain
MEDAAAVIESAVAALGVSKLELALRSGVDAATISRFANGRRMPSLGSIDIVLRPTHHQLVSIPSRGATAIATGAEIRNAVRRDDHQSALRAFVQFNDDLLRENGALRVGLTLGEPAPTGDRRWDSALAALVDYRLSSDGLPHAPWVDDTDRILDDPWIYDGTDYSARHDREITPPQFLRRGIIINPAELQSV